MLVSRQTLDVRLGVSPGPGVIVAPRHKPQKEQERQDGGGGEQDYSNGDLRLVHDPQPVIEAFGGDNVAQVDPDASERGIPHRRENHGSNGEHEYSARHPLKKGTVPVSENGQPSRDGQYKRHPDLRLQLHGLQSIAIRTSQPRCTREAT